MTKNKAFTTVLFLLFMANNAFGWWEVGHKTVANIAEDNLSMVARKKVLSILGTTDLASVATWADDIRKQRPTTAGWHYVDMEIRSDQTVDTVAKYCENDNCVVAQIKKEIKELTAAEKNGKPDDNVNLEEDLKFLIHFVGDMHQPLHCSDDTDKGGNGKIVRLFNPDGSGDGTQTKLHAVWDGLIEVTNTEDPRKLADDLENSSTYNTNHDVWLSGTGTVESWALESYEIAKDKIYPEFTPGPTPAGTEVSLTKDYYKDMRPIVDEQLEKAGLRLAHILNDIYSN